MKQLPLLIARCIECPYCIYFPGAAVRVCVHPKTIERISNNVKHPERGLRIDEPDIYLDRQGFPDWCPLEDVKE